MSKQCADWQQKLNAEANGDKLPPEQRGALQDHLSGCAECRKTREADMALRGVLGLHIGLLSEQNALSFDSGVLEGYRAEPAMRPTLLCRIRSHWQARCAALPVEFLQQMMGGTLAAASVTFICLFAAMHPKSLEAKSDAPASSVRNEPPVPLESLLRDSSPRAALLWTSPRTSARMPHPQPAVQRQRNNGMGRRGSRGLALTIG